VDFEGTAAMLDVQEINDIETLGHYRHVWRQLVDETADATFFHTLQWLEVYWKHYGAGQRLRVLIVAQDGLPLGILPMVVRRERRKIGAVSILTYPLDDWGSFFGPLGPCPDATLRAGLEYFARAERDWDLLDVRWVGDGPAARAETEAALAAAELPASCSVRATTALIDLPTTWDAYFSALPNKWRANFRRWCRRLNERGELSLLRYRPAGEATDEGDPRWDLYDACEEIARRSWQGSSTTGTTISHDEVRPFLRDAHAAGAKSGHVEINLLKMGETPIAYAYNYHRQGRVYGLRVGYDPEASRDGAGNVLYGLAIRDSI
jgi:CelD/BcsL family acetyltransferase involved in cellulose biosynthesis